MVPLIDNGAQTWQPVRPELTRGITGRLLLDSTLKIVLIRVDPGGSFRPRRDNYGYLFQILSGQALARAEDQQFRLSAGMDLQVDAGELHSYENRGAGELLLISANFAAK